MPGKKRRGGRVERGSEGEITLTKGKQGLTFSPQNRISKKEGGGKARGPQVYRRKAPWTVAKTKISEQKKEKRGDPVMSRLVG